MKLFPVLIGTCLATSQDNTNLELLAFMADILGDFFGEIPLDQLETMLAKTTDRPILAEPPTDNPLWIETTMEPIIVDDNVDKVSVSINKALRGKDHVLPQYVPLVDFNPAVPLPPIVPIDLTHVSRGRMATLIRALHENENSLSQYPPLLSTNKDYAPVDDTELGLVTIGPLLFKSYQSTVFRIKEYKDALIKYQADCDRPDDHIHPLIRDYVFLRELEVYDVSPRVFWLSPAVAVPFNYSDKTSFGMTIEERMQCVRNGRTVRALIVEDAGRSIGHWIDTEGPFPIRTALLILRIIVEKLKKIHSLGIIHGDIHASNVVVSKEGDVRIIDFGSAVFIEELSDAPIRVPMSHNHWLLSPDEILGYRASVRGDLFRAVMMGAYMMAGDAWGNHLQSMEHDPEAMLRFKQRAFIFDVPGRFQIGQTLDDELEANIVRCKLQKILNIVRQSDVGRMHDNVIAELVEVDDILTGQIGRGPARSETYTSGVWSGREQGQ